MPTTEAAYDKMKLPQLGDQARAHISAGDKSIDKAEQQYKSAGIYLLHAKDRLKVEKPGVPWQTWLKENGIGVGLRRANQYIQIGKGEVTLEGMRSANREANAALRGKSKQASRDAHNSRLDGEHTHPHAPEMDPDDERSEVYTAIVRRLNAATLSELRTVKGVLDLQLGEVDEGTPPGAQKIKGAEAKEAPAKAPPKKRGKPREKVAV